MTSMHGKPTRHIAELGEKRSEQTTLKDEHSSQFDRLQFA